jgi:hypothetical protein
MTGSTASRPQIQRKKGDGLRKVAVESRRFDKPGWASALQSLRQNLVEDWTAKILWNSKDGGRSAVADKMVRKYHKSSRAKV